MSLFYSEELAPIHAMTFDLDDTLYDNGPVIRGLEEKALTWLHTHHPCTQAWSSSQWRELKLALAQQYPDLIHDVSRWRFTQIQQGLIHLGYQEQQAIQAANETMEQVMIWRHQITVPQITHQVLTQLAQHFPLVAITNGNVDPERIGLSSYFQFTLNAGPDGFAKPDSAMFHSASDKLGIAPHHILHVGDSLSADVVGAKEAGMMACWLALKETSLSELEEHQRPHLMITELEDLLSLLAHSA